MLCSKFVFLLPNPVSTDTPTEELLPPVLWCNRAKVKVTLVTAEINAGRKGKNKHTHTKKKPFGKAEHGSGIPKPAWEVEGSSPLADIVLTHT